MMAPEVTLDFNLTAGQTWTIILRTPVNESVGLILSIEAILLLWILAMALIIIDMERPNDV